MYKMIEPLDAAKNVFGEQIERELEAIRNLNHMFALEYVRNHEVDWGEMLIARAYVKKQLQVIIDSLENITEDQLLRLKVDFLLKELSKKDEPVKRETPSEVMARNKIKALQAGR